MHILVTRPHPDAEETAGHLRALGHYPIIQPLLEIIFTTPPDEVPEPGAIVLTSRNGVRAFARWPRWGEWKDRPVFVTGTATMQDARAAGFTEVHTASGSSTELAELIKFRFPKDVGPVLYPAPRDRSGVLIESLGDAGYEVQIFEAYRAEPVKGLEPKVVAGLRSRTIDGVLFYSRRTAITFGDLLHAEHIDLPKEIVLLALSERVAEPLRSLTGDIRISPTPNERCLLALLPRPDSSGPI